MYDNLYTANDIASTLVHQTTVFMMSHPLQSWPHSPCIRHHMHCIFVITTSPMISHPLLYDITPTFSVRSYSLIYIMTSNPYVITLLYWWHDKLYIWNHIQYVGQHIHYTCDITATNLCHHSHCIVSITPTLCMTSHSAYEWQILHYTRHHILTLWHQTTIFMTWRPLYLTWCLLYLCHHIHCFVGITPTVFMRSHPL